ncbi:tRNA pseudouridine(55) synthase TruB [Salirhabdus salicampi]|nr:tRNA pseudouridine(55) synthase TruB [Salirhabdus salicampi]MCP8616479.1 tRNA pseudouridine(55) synthase TruB [Salirhabdus salicampi]
MDGVLPLWKPKGLTSHDCVFKVRKIAKTKKVGHTGTLDPTVEGMLPICIGQATKLSPLLMGGEKVYEAEVCLGIATETEDQEGDIIERKHVPSLSEDKIKEVLATFVGDIEQIPPKYSAIRVNGKRLYEYAREGIEVERPKRVVSIYDMELISSIKNDDGKVTFSVRVRCSKGTYIRTLCVDIGKSLGFPAHMSNLTRTQSGTFTQNKAITLEDAEEAAEKGELQNYIISMNAALQDFDEIIISDEDEVKYRNGQVLPFPEGVVNTPLFRIVNERNQLIALYERHPAKRQFMKPYRVFSYTNGK